MIQRAIERVGIPTVSVSILREYTEKVRPPRAIYLRWPFGHPLGEPGNIDQQAAVMGKMLEALKAIQTPGAIVDLGWKWRRETYPPAQWLSAAPHCRPQNPVGFEEGYKEVWK